MIASAVLSDLNGSNAPVGSFGMGCGDDTHYNQANAPASVYSSNVWFQLTGIFPGGLTQPIAVLIRLHNGKPRNCFRSIGLQSHNKWAMRDT
jgi:hypothetical protein